MTIDSGSTSRANAKRFGVQNGSDDTTVLSACIAAGIAAVEIPFQSGAPWHTQPITWTTKKRLMMQDGAHLKASTGGYGDTDKNLIAGVALDQCHFLGFDSILEMRRESLVVSADGPHCLNLKGCTNSAVEGLVFKNGSGDGLYLGPSGTTACTDIRVLRCQSLTNRRAGISLESGLRVRIEDCILRSTSGATPAAGLYITPAASTDKVSGVIVRNCLAENNAEANFYVNLRTLTSASTVVDLLFDACSARGTGTLGLQYATSSVFDGGPGGTVEFRDCFFRAGTTDVAQFIFDLQSKYTVELNRCVFDLRGKGDVTFYVENTGTPHADGGIIFTNCKIIDSQDRMPILLDTSAATIPQGQSSVKISGNIELENAALGRTGYLDVCIPGLAVSFADETLPSWPNSDLTLRAVVNARTMPTGWELSKVITDSVIYDADNANSINGWYSRLQTIRDSSHHLLQNTGRYISGRRVGGVGFEDRWPYGTIDDSLFTPAYLGFDGNADWVNISIAAARTEFLNAIEDQVRIAWSPILFVDNMAHPNALPTGFTWADTCTFLRDLKTRMNAMGVRTIINISGASFQWTQAERNMIVPVVDGYSSETFWHPQIHDAATTQVAATRITNAATQTSVYRQFLDAGKFIVGIPVSQGGYTQAQNGTFQAGVTMCIREMGDPLFNCVGTADEHLYPTTLGAPTADYTFDGTIMARTFVNGTITVDCSDRSVTLT